MKKTILLLSALSLTLFSIAQDHIYSDVKTLYIKSIGVISEKNQVSGYYTFYLLDKVNRKENRYALSILDNNLAQTHIIEIVKPKDYRLIESSFNGTHFCFAFLTKKTQEILIFDRQGKQTGSYTAPEMTNFERSILQQSLMNEEDVSTGNLVALPNVGFIWKGYIDGKGMRVGFECIDTLGHVLWHATSGTKFKTSYEAINVLMSNNSFVASLVAMRDGIFSGTYESHLLFTNVKTGAEQFRIKNTSKQFSMIPYGVDFDEATGDYLVYGEYADISVGIFNNDYKTIGLYMQIIDASGQIKKESLLSWKDDLGSAMGMDENGKFENNTNIVVHKIFKTADNHYFVVGEFFKKNLSAVGILAGGGNASFFKIVTFNMVLLDLDKDLKLANVKEVKKNKTIIELPSGFGQLPTGMLVQVLRSFGCLDYSFTSLSQDRKSFNVAYVNYNRDGDKDNKYIAGTISRTDEQKIVEDKINISSKPTWFNIYPAKPGYICIYEFSKKEKKLSVRLEKLNY